MSKMPVVLQINSAEGIADLASKARNSSAVADVPFQQLLFNEMNNRAPDNRLPEKALSNVEAKDSYQPASKQEGTSNAPLADGQVQKEDGKVDAESKPLAENEEKADKTQEVAANSGVIEHMLAIAGKISRAEAADDKGMTELAETESESVLALKAGDGKDESIESKLAAAMQARNSESGEDAGKKETEMPVEVKDAGARHKQPEIKVADDTGDKASFGVALQKASETAASRQASVETQVNPAVQAQSAASQIQAAAPALPREMFDPASNRIMQPFGTNGWDQAIGQKAIWMAGKEQHSASLMLNPPELGPLQVVLKVSNSHATANFMSAHADVRAALEDSMPRLRAMLEQAGIQLGQTHVGADTPNNQYGAASDQKAAAGFAGAREVDGMQEVTTQVIRQPAVKQGLVDTFA